MTVSTRMAAVCLPLLLAASALSGQSYPGAAPAERVGFGAAVAAADGVAFVGEGANVMRPGIVYVYGADADGSWREVERLMAPDATDADGFGGALAASGTTLLVGQVRASAEGSVHVFGREGGSWASRGRLVPGDASGAYGAAVALDGDLAAVGAPGGADEPGRVHVFRAGPRGWSEEGVLVASEVASGTAFGSALVVSGDLILVGAPAREGGDGTGTAIVYRRDGSGSWVEEARLAPAGGEDVAGFGAAVALREDAALVSAPGAEADRGVVFEFRRTAGSGAWSPAGLLRPFEGSGAAAFGTAVVYSGERAYVGAPGSGAAGAVYVFGGEAGEWLDAERLLPRRVAAGGGFGATLAIDGDIGVAGATREDHGAGTAVILARRAGEWTPIEKVASEEEALPAVTGGEVRCGTERRAAGFPCNGVDLLAFLPVQDIGGSRGYNLSDIWGWTDPETGREYALVARMDGMSFVDVTNPLEPRYLGNLPRTAGTPTSVWRDVKVYRNHAFIVADGVGAHGVQIFDLTRLRDPGDAPATFDADAHYDRIASSHNIVINTETGFAYVVGARDGGETCGGGLHMIDIRDPQAPRFAGCFADPQTGDAGTGYTHDAQCVVYSGPDADYRGRELCFGANETALSIADVTDKANPVAIARASYPNVGYAHQGWLTEDQRYFFMNDELDEIQGLTTRTRTLIWDVVDVDDPQLVREFFGTTEASDHNLYIRGDVMYQSHYRAGLRILDISDPEAPRETAYFDTMPYGEDVAGYGGSWSNYPFFPSGTIIVSSEREGFFVLRVRAPAS